MKTVATLPDHKWKAVAYLVCVTGENNNKYYNIFWDGENTYGQSGRVGASEVIYFYEGTTTDHTFKQLLRDKTKPNKKPKPYTDVTALHATDTGAKEFAPLPPGPVSQLMSDLQKYAHRQVEQNYTTGAAAVTPAMVETAQRQIDELASMLNPSVGAFNRKLVEGLFITIPRKMYPVSDFLAKGPGDFEKLLENEQNLLDTMRTQVKMATKAPTTASGTILDSLGIIVETVTPEEEAAITQMLGYERRLYQEAFAVINLATEALFNHWRETHAMPDAVNEYFHGSKNSNWLDILDTGLIIRHARSSGMFGSGLYFANVATKSLGYTGRSYDHYGDKSIFMSINKVHTGKMYTAPDCMTGMTLERFLKEYASDSVLGRAGYTRSYGGTLRNDEIIVYRAQQQTIKYLIRLKG